MTERMTEGWAWPAMLSLGFAMVLPAALQPGLLASAGLAPLLVAVAVAGTGGVSLAWTEWRLDRPVAPGADALANLWSLLLVASLAAPLVQGAGTGGRVGVALAWLVGAAVVRWSGAVAVPVLVVMTAVAAGVVAGTGAAEVRPWTLLEPRWQPVHDWLTPAVVFGFLMAGAGLGQWRAVPKPLPGRDHAVYLVVGLASLVTAAVAVRHATWYDRPEAFGLADPAVGAVAACALVAAGVAVLNRPDQPRSVWAYAATGLVATLWFAGPAAAVLPVWWGTLVPLGMAVFAFALAARAQGRDRAVAGVLGAVLLLAAGLGWPGFPASAAGAAAAAVTVVVAVWVVGTRALLGRTA